MNRIVSPSLFALRVVILNEYFLSGSNVETVASAVLPVFTTRSVFF